MATESMGSELSWDASIEKDRTFALLPEGDYAFTVTSFERARHEGSARLPPCNKAVLALEVTNGEQRGIITHTLFLHTRTEGMLCAFFAAIGLRAHGERINMDWGAVPGSIGRCKVGVRKYKNRYGEERESNEIKFFYDYAVLEEQ